MSRRRLIVNADDFGLSAGTNEGIMAAFNDGILTSTTALVNMPAFAAAAELATAHPKLGVGVHLTLLWGAPVSPLTTVSSLLDRDGGFPRSAAVLARRYFLRRLDLTQVVTEFRNQIRRFLDTGLTPTHIDTHKHIHCLPGIFAAAREAAQAFGITCLRLPIEQSAPRQGEPRPRRHAADVLRRHLVSWGCRGQRRRFADALTSDHFIGIDYTSRLDTEALQFMLRTLRPGTTELMCHPARNDDAAAAWVRNPQARERELRALLDPGSRSAVAAGEIELINYRELSGAEE